MITNVLTTDPPNPNGSNSGGGGVLSGGWSPIGVLLYLLHWHSLWT